MPASPNASNYPLNEQWAPLETEESTPSKETTGPTQANTQSETAMKTNSQKWEAAHARPLLEPAGFSQLVLVLDL